MVNITRNNFVVTSYYCCCLLFKPVVFGFTLDLLFVWSLALDHPNCAKCGVCLLEWALSQIRHWLVIATSSIPPLPEHSLKAGHIVNQRVFSWIGVYISLLVACRVLPVPKILECRGQGSMQAPT